MAMIKKLLLSLGVIFLCTGIAYSQQSTVKGIVKDTKDEVLPFARVLLKQEGRTVGGATTDAKGEYQIPAVAAGTYDMEAAGGVGCSKSVTLTGIYVGSAEVKFINLEIDCGSTETELTTVVIVYEPQIGRAHV